MAEDGIDEDQIDAWREASLAALAEHADPEPPFELWPENELAFALLREAQLDRVMGMGGVVVTGVSSSELLALCALHQVPPAMQAELCSDIRFAVAAMLPALNRREE